MNFSILFLIMLIGSTGLSYDIEVGEAEDIICLPMPDLEPATEPTLKSMGEMVTNNSILYPVDAYSYITPENEVVKWYAENTILTDDGLLWKHNSSAVEFKHQTDNFLFNHPLNGDMWQNPDYYLTHGLIGDCEDFSVAYASILEAKGIHAKVKGVELINDRKHWMVEYYFNNRINYADINKECVVIRYGSNPTVKQEYVSITKCDIVILTQNMVVNNAV